MKSRKYLTVFINCSIMILSCNQNPTIDKEKEIEKTEYKCNSLKDALSDFRHQSSFIRLKFSDKNAVRLLIVPNRKFFYYFNKKYNTNEHEYQKIIFEIVKKDSIITISNNDIEQFKDYILDEDNNKLKKKSLDFVLKTYFENKKVMKKRVLNKLEVVNFLILNSYRVWMDDETGYIVITKCQKNDYSKRSKTLVE